MVRSNVRTGLALVMMWVLAVAYNGSATTYTSGYVVMEKELKIDKPAGKSIEISLTAGGQGGAGLGIAVGYQQADADAQVRWVTPQITWNQALPKERRTLTWRYEFPAQARGPRVWVGVYRSNQKGRLSVEDFQAKPCREVPKEERLALNRLAREWRYLEERIRRIQKAGIDAPQLVEILRKAQESEDLCRSGEPALGGGLEKSYRRIREYSAAANHLLNPGQDVVVTFSDPYTRLSPTEVITRADLRPVELTALPGEYVALGVTLANGVNERQGVEISLPGLAKEHYAAEVRRQTFLENWYQREKERLADPLPLLIQDNGTWKLDLAPGETVRLYVGIHALNSSGGTVNGAIRVRAVRRETTLPFALHIVSGTVPTTPRFEHCAWIWPELNVGSHAPEATARDLADHGVTMMEFPYIPKAVFTPEGDLVSVDYSIHDRWLTTYGPYVRRFVIFWEGAFSRFACAQGGNLKPFSPAWERAYGLLLRAFMDHVQSKGFGLDRFVILADDEPHSSDIARSPDGEIARTRRVYELTRKAAPKLPILATLGDYAFPKDVAALLPFVDIWMPHWPYPTVLPAAAPKTFNPRLTYPKEIYPKLVSRQRETGSPILSYHVASGKFDDVLLYSRAYPILAVGMGYAGAGVYAYNVATNSSWDDTDGWVDYSFVYDGSETHPENLKVNPAKELIVPSIRWQAMRAGVQDARILLFLKDACGQGKCSGPVRAAVEEILHGVDLMVRNNDRVASEQVARLSARLRKVYSEAIR